MMRARLLLAAAISALIGSTPAAAGGADPSTYRVTMQLRDGGALVASPTLDVNAGEPATVMIDDGKGHRYEVRITPSAAERGKVFVHSSIDVASDEAHYSGKPALMVALGEASAIELGTAAKPFRVDFTVTLASD